MKVFVSSTVYDLIDVRAEICEHLRALGITPVLSDDKTSGFEVANDTNSIQTCLVNLEASDEVIAILDKRYGSSLADRGFDDVSATHLEIRHALKTNRTVRVYVRDRLEADFATWKKNGRQHDIELPWVGKSGKRLLSLLDEISYLQCDDTPNWYTTFSNSRDLKEDLSKYFGPKQLNARLIEAISANRFPLLSARLEASPLTAARGARRISIGIYLKVATSSPAFHVCARWLDTDENRLNMSILAPGQEVAMSLIATLDRNTEANSCLEIEYFSPLGIQVTDTFEVGVKFAGDVLISGCPLINRRFSESSLPEFEITHSNS